MPRAFLSITLLLWVAAVILASGAFALEAVPAPLRWPAAAAVALEASFYLTLAFKGLRERWPPSLLILLAPVPYLVYSVPAGLATPAAALSLLAAAAIPVFWFKLFKPAPWSRFMFLAVLAAPILFKWSALIYSRPHPDLRLEFLGQLLWIRLGIISIDRHAGVQDPGLGFLPRAREWRVGVTLFAAALLPIVLLVLLSGFATFELPAAPLWETLAMAAGTFFGILWVVALSEEYFFRGLLQQWLDGLLSSRIAGLICASVLFGAAHLGFRQFPNWRFALVAAAAGLFYGIAFRRGGGIRAAMVTHALMVTTWRTFFR